MRILTTAEAMRRASRELRRGAVVSGTQAALDRMHTLGLVPTMGALHEGHLSLVRAAKRSCDRVAVTIFVNPLQFGPNEDLGRYPRTFEADCAALEREGVDLLFAPTAEEMYPARQETWVDVPEIGGRLDGASRPGHFRGVATVVSKLFHIAEPDRAYFGQKDAAQVAVLRAMVRELNFGLEMVVCPTVRDADGLALSSRNRYLSAEERGTALGISRALGVVERAFAAGERSMPVLLDMLRRELAAAGPELRIDYAEIVDPETLEEAADLNGGALAAVAAWVGETRLIDNLLLPAADMRQAGVDVLLPVPSHGDLPAGKV